MKDKNGRVLKVGTQFFTTYRCGLYTVTSLSDDESYMTAGNGEGTGFGYDQETFLKEMPDAVIVRSWKEMAQQALDVQNASNLSGVVHTFSNIISEVRYRLESEGKKSTDKVNQHPICILFSDKIAHLTGTQFLGHDEVTKAYKWAHDIIENRL